MGKKPRTRAEIMTAKTLLEPNKSHRPVRKPSMGIRYPPRDTGSRTSGWSHTNKESSEVLEGARGLAQAKVTRYPFPPGGDKLYPAFHSLAAAAAQT